MGGGRTVTSSSEAGAGVLSESIFGIEERSKIDQREGHESGQSALSIRFRESKKRTDSRRVFSEKRAAPGFGRFTRYFLTSGSFESSARSSFSSSSRAFFQGRSRISLIC